MKNNGSYSLFLYVAGITTALFVVILYLSWTLLAPGLHLYIPVLSVVIQLIFIMLACAAVLMYALLCLCAATHLSQSSVVTVGLSIYLRLFYGPICFLHYILRINKDRISQAYIQFLNRLVLLQNFTVPPNKLLILIPHCLQWDQCPHKITRVATNCKKCGRCPVGAILALAEAHGSYLAVATGGTLARQIVHKVRPKAIIAIACERDLVSGMQDVFPMPVLGLLNKRPNGPCFNTDVDIDALRILLEIMTGEKYGY